MNTIISILNAHYHSKYYASLYSKSMEENVYKSTYIIYIMLKKVLLRAKLLHGRVCPLLTHSISHSRHAFLPYITHYRTCFVFKTMFLWPVCPCSSISSYAFSLNANLFLIFFSLYFKFFFVFFSSLKASLISIILVVKDKGDRYGLCETTFAIH